MSLDANGQLYRAVFGAANAVVKDLVKIETLTGNITLDNSYPVICKLDPGGSARDITAQAESAEFEGRVHLIINAADAAENLVFKDASGNTVGTVNQNEAGLFYNQGTSGWTLVAIWTIALS